MRDVPAFGRDVRPLIGRDDDLAVLRAFVATSAVTGGAVLLFGDPGAGKTALLDAVAAEADADGVRVLRAAGVEFESEVSFASLHQLLYPILDQLPALDATLRSAVDVALGLRDGLPPSGLTLSNGVLGLLARAAAGRPLLLIVDDVPWLDRASALVLGLIARRLTSTRVGFLGACRSSESGFLDGAGLARLDIGPLDESAAAMLVSDRFPALAAPVRRRLLAEADGNPLALLELPVALSAMQRSGSEPLPAHLPLSRRLQKVFEVRVAALPASTRHALLLAVLEGTGSLTALLAATGDPDAITHLAEAERSGLVQLEYGTDQLTFRHPLTRSAVFALSGADDRRRAHEALAKLLSGQPDRHAWHLARAVVGFDEPVAALLDGVAQQSRRRGDAVGAISALLRAGELTPPGPVRERRLAEAAYIGAVVTGDLREVPRLLEEAGRSGDGRPKTLAAAVAAAHHLLLSGDGDIDTAHRLLVEAIEMVPRPYDADDDTLVEALHTLGWVAYFGGRAELWASFHRATASMTPPLPEVLYLLEATFADPARTALGALTKLDAAVESLSLTTDPLRVIRVSVAARFVDRLPQCRAALQRLRGDTSAGSATTLSLHALSHLGVHHFMAGEWDEVQIITTEHLRISEEHNYQLMQCLGIYLHGMLAAVRGDDEAVAASTDRIVAWAIPRQVVSTLRLAAHIKTLAALGAGRYDDAFRHASSISPAGELASHVPHALWLILDLTEAATHTGRHDAAAAHVAAAVKAQVAAISPRYALVVGAAAAMTATDDKHATARFEAALAVQGADRWPFDLARVQLLHGEQLRRAKATTQARIHLTEALETFRRLGAHPWSTRAAAELRATGVTAAGVSDPRATLTPQQREIAALAASGLTNKQIGERLYLSPRTVSTHLYQIFPKLRITSRAALRDALAEHPDQLTQPLD